MKQFFKNILPINNRTEMPTALFVVKKILELCCIRSKKGLRFGLQ